MSNKLMPKVPDKLLPCPFCGGKASETIGVTGLRAIICTNYNSCGAYVTFDNPLANRDNKYAPVFWNKRK